jgi:hypothetical protein
MIAAEVVLILLTLSMIAAILLPVVKGVSADAPRQDFPMGPGRRR